MSRYNADLALVAAERPKGKDKTPRIKASDYQAAAKAAVKRTNKFGARKTEVDGILFDSKAEAERYGTLKLLERAKQVRGVTVKPEFALRINGTLIGFYTPDFGYFEAGRQYMDDVKGVTTDESSLRMRVFMACYPEIRLRIVDGHGRAKEFKQRQFTERRLAA
jgi:Protein of unknown function (DUF1064)